MSILERSTPWTTMCSSGSSIEGLESGFQLRAFSGSRGRHHHMRQTSSRMWDE